MKKFIKNMMKISCIALFIFVFLLFLNLLPILRNVRSVSKLHGKYIENLEFAKIELSINSDGTYDQKVTLIPSSKIHNAELTINKDGTYDQDVILIHSSKTDTVSGTWSYDNEDGYFTFDHNFMNVVDGYGNFDPNYAKPRENGLVITSAYRWFFRIYIDGSPEGTDYKKVN